MEEKNINELEFKELDFEEKVHDEDVQVVNQPSDEHVCENHDVPSHEENKSEAVESNDADDAEAEKPVVDSANGEETSITPTTEIAKDEHVDETKTEGSKKAEKEVEQKNDENKSKIGGFWKKVLAAIACSVIVGASAGAAFAGVQHLVGGPTNTRGEISHNVGTATLIEAPKGDVVNTSISQVAASVMPSVVSINNLSVQEVEFFFFGTREYEVEIGGSGIIIGKNDDELLIVTNNHVVEGNKTLTVTFIDNSSASATVKGFDANIDIAVIAVKLSDMSPSALDEIKVAAIGDSNNLVVGEPAIAIGNALGYGQSVTSGIISAVNRKLDGFDARLIQTDAAINPGNSGGALLNIKGEVIGINTIKVNADAVEGMGYAIPISDIQEILQEIMNRETREKVSEHKRGALGIACVDVNEAAAVYYNMPKGIYINQVVEGGAADVAGISKGSIITKFNGLSVSASTELVDLLSYYEIGETVELEIAVPTSNGEYETKTIEVTLQKKTQ